MVRVAIKERLNLDPQEWVQADLHSFINIGNVLKGELGRLARDTGDLACEEGAQMCANLASAVERDGVTIIGDFSAQMKRVRRHLDLIAVEHPGMMSRCEMIERILEMLAELLEDHESDRLKWGKVRKEDVITKLHRFLKATERVSRNRFYITFPPASAGAFTYLVEFNIHTPDQIIEIPPILNDLIRDLAANARKYSNPNSRIEIDLRFPEKDVLQLKVRDQGIGIPVEEISNVVRYGYRGSNAIDRVTMGKGIGLTKAYAVTQHFKGSFWIESTAGEGTMIELTLHRN